MKKILEVFGTRLKKLRVEKGMSQDALADKLNVHLSYIGLLERGERAPSILTLSRIAKYFGIKPADLITEEKAPQKLTKQQKELVQIIDEGSSEEVDKLYEIARMVSGK